MVDSTETTRPQTTEVWVFFAAIVVLNALFVFGIAQGWLPKSIFPMGRFLLLGGVLAVVVFLWRGLPSVLDLVRPLTVWKINPLWFVAAVLWPIVFAVVFLELKSLVTGEGWTLNDPGIGMLSSRRLFVTVVIGALIGEIVWVGYAIRSLGYRYSRLLAAVITGTVWGLWWLPMAYFQIGIVPDLSWIGLWMNMIGIAFFCTFFYVLTGSGLVIFLMQFCFNCSVLAFPVLPRSGGALVYEIYSALYMIVGFFFVMVLLPRFQRARAG